jgi:hypothetical protein
LRRVADLCAALGNPLMPLDIEVEFKLDTRLAHRPDAKKIAGVSDRVDRPGFDGGKYPWFCNRFAHPKGSVKGTGKPSRW